MDRAYVIAAQARRFGILADRPELLYPDREERVRRAIDYSYAARHPLDALLVGGADETDRICAAAVEKLRRGDSGNTAIVDLLSSLPANYLLAVYHALPEKARAVARVHEVWAYHLNHAPEEVPGAMADLELMAADPSPEIAVGLDGEEGEEFRRATAALLSARLGFPPRAVVHEGG